MRWVVLVICFALTLQASCGGDCKACHATLDIEYDARHKALATCKTCHTDDSLRRANMGLEACGADCFACHDVQKIIQAEVNEHQVLTQCQACHLSLKRYPKTKRFLLETFDWRLRLDSDLLK